MDNKLDYLPQFTEFYDSQKLVKRILQYSQLPEELDRDADTIERLVDASRQETESLVAEKRYGMRLVPKSLPPILGPSDEAIREFVLSQFFPVHWDERILLGKKSIEYSANGEEMASAVQLYADAMATDYIFPMGVLAKAFRRSSAIIRKQRKASQEPNEAAINVRNQLSGQALNLFEFLLSKKHFVSYDTLREEPKFWRKPTHEVADLAIKTALERLQRELNSVEPQYYTLKNELSSKRVKLEKLVD